MSDHRTTLTLYFCGSGNNLAPYKVAKFAIPYMVSIGDGRFSAFDGPGGNPKSKPEYLMDDDGLIKVDGWGGKVWQGKDKISSNYKSKTGGGANANIKKAMQVIDTQINSTKPIKTINLWRPQPRLGDRDGGGLGYPEALGERPESRGQHVPL